MELSEQFDNDVFNNRLTESFSPYRYGSIMMYRANNLTKTFQAAVFVNTTSKDVAAIYPSFLYEAVVRSALGKPNLKLQFTTVPYPVT